MTRKHWLSFAFLVLFSLVFVTSQAHAGTVTASSCAQSNIQSAINSAASGDTVIVPSGSCTWTTSVSISNKGITLKGAGIGSTNITDGTSGQALNINIDSASHFVDVSGFTFIKSSNNSSGMIQIDGTQAVVGFRFHHNRILMASAGARGIVPTSVYGLIDNNTFDVTATDGSIQMISPIGSPDSTDGGFTPWMRPLSLGTNNAVFIEDNTFNYGSIAEDCIDSYGGSRIVIRHNKFNNSHIGFHGTDSGNRRSLFSFEIYSNTFTNNTSSTFRAATVRGGTGVVYNNTYGGSHGAWNGVTLMVYRGTGLDQSGWGACDGTQWQLNSTDFKANGSRQCSTSGGVKFCSLDRDRVCTSDSTCSAAGAGTCSTYFDGSGSEGYACRDQPGRTHNQALEPIYAWGNSGGVDVGMYDGGTGANIGNYLQSGRDFVNSSSAKPGYVAYTYPHPLQSGGSASNPNPTVNPPSGLTAIVN